MLSLLTRRGPVTGSLKTPVKTVLPFHDTSFGMPTFTDSSVPDTALVSAWRGSVCDDREPILNSPRGRRHGVFPTEGAGRCPPGRRAARQTCEARPMVAFDDALRSTISANLAAHERREHALRGRRRAAVALVLVDSDAERDDGDPIVAAQIDMSVVPGEVRDQRGRRLDGRMVGVAGGAAFLLCRRAARLNRHAGQWALPGGRIDDGETALDAALRELDEELGIRLAPGRVGGWLDASPTRGGYVTPPGVWGGGSDPPITPAPDEVLAVYRIGLRALAASEPRFIDIPESDRPVLQVPLGNDLIHAPTGAVLYQFQQIGLLGNAGKRVDDLEQPVFAWK